MRRTVSTLRCVGRAAIVGAVLLTAGAAAPARAHAHVELVRSDPADGAVLSAAPRELRLTFSEALVASGSVAEVLDPEGRPVPGVRARVDPRRRALLTIALPRLEPGVYSTIWTATSDDGHRSRGLHTLRAGPGTAGSRLPVAPPGAAPSAVTVAARWVDFALAAGLIGGLAVVLLVLGPPAGHPAGFRRPARRRALSFAVWCGAGALALGVFALPLEALALIAWDPGTSTGLLLDTRWGALWVTRQALLAALLAIAVALRRAGPDGPVPPRRPGVLIRAGTLGPAAGLLAGGLMVVRAMDGHAAAVGSHRALAVVALAVHLLAAAVWIGGLAALIVGCHPLLRPGGAAAGDMRSTWISFGRLAAVSVGVLAASGLYTAGRQVASADALIATLYGQTLIVKQALLAGAGTLALLAATVLLPRLGAWRPAPRRLRVLLAAEAATGLAVLLAAALMSSSPPARGPRFEPEAPARSWVTRSAGDLLVTLRVTPNRAGHNAFTVIAASTRHPRPSPPSGVELRVAGRPPVALAETAPGRFHAAGDQLSAAGRRHVDIVVRRHGAPTRTAGFDWTVAGLPRRTVVSNRPLEPLLTGAAALLALAGMAGATAWAGARRLRAPLRVRRMTGS